MTANRTPRPRRLPVLTLLAALTVPFAAHAITLGGFQIQARGAQSLNLETGRTDLPQGGTATDAAHGLTLQGRTMSYEAGRSLRATGVTIRTAGGGNLRADTVTYDVPGGRLDASGHLAFQNSALKDLTARTVRLDTRSGAVVATGGVTARTPALKADRVVVLDGGKLVLLSGNYTLTSAGTRYAKAGSRAVLLLNGTNGRQTATATPPAAVLARFAPYLN